MQHKQDQHTLVDSPAEGIGNATDLAGKGEGEGEGRSK